MTIEKTTPPAWLTAIFSAIDEKTFGEAFDVFAEDISFGFGVGSWTGREMVREKLRGFDEEMDTVHHVNEFWDGGQVKFVSGEVEMKFHDGRPSVRPIMTHIFHMDDADPTSIRRWTGSVGPISF